MNKPHHYTLRELIEEKPEIADIPVCVYDGHQLWPVNSYFMPYIQNTPSSEYEHLDEDEDVAVFVENGFEFDKDYLVFAGN